MENELLLVLDETGTTNYPQNSSVSDYAVGGIAFRRDELNGLVTLSKMLADESGKSDYKYKHIQRDTNSRRLILNGLQKLKAPSGVFGFYAQGGALLAEKERSIEACNENGREPEETTRKSAEAIRKGDRQASLDSFYDYFANCIYPYSGAKKCFIRVIMDRRTDLDRLQAACKEAATNYTNHPTFGDVSQHVSFDEVAGGELSHVVRIAGAIAGDIRMYFNSFANTLSSILPEKKLVISASAFPKLTPEELEKHTRIAKYSGEIGYEDVYTGNKETCMIRGYTNQLLANNLSFAWANGVMGYFYIPSREYWEIHQTPELVTED